jgi:hypothetical protein
VALAIGATRSAVSGILKRLRDAEPHVAALQFRDHERLLILDRVLRGTSAEAVAKDFAKVKGCPVHRKVILYLVWWILNDLAVAGEGTVADPLNHDLVDWPSWWRAAPNQGVAA